MGLHKLMGGKGTNLNAAVFLPEFSQFLLVRVTGGQLQGNPPTVPVSTAVLESHAMARTPAILALE